MTLIKIVHEISVILFVIVYATFDCTGTQLRATSVALSTFVELP